MRYLCTRFERVLCGFQVFARGMNGGGRKEIIFFRMVTCGNENFAYLCSPVQRNRGMSGAGLRG